MGAFQVLLICTGNSCRSPMASGMLLHLLQQMPEAGSGPLPIIQVGSAGTSATDGFPATNEAVTACGERGIDIAGHRSRRLTLDLLSASDRVLAMEEHHRRSAQALWPEGRERISTIAYYAGDHGDQGDQGDGVRDPLGGKLLHYRETLLELERLLEKALPRLIAEARGKAEGGE